MKRCSNCEHTIDFHVAREEIEAHAASVGESFYAIANELAIGVWRYEGPTVACCYPDCECQTYEAAA